MVILRSSPTLPILAPVLLLAGCIGAAAQTGDFPVGSYQSGPFTITFQEGGAFRVQHTSGAGVTGTYKASGEHIELTDRDGELACQGSVGKYTWKVDRDRLIFSVVEDECDGRMKALTSEPLVKKP